MYADSRSDNRLSCEQNELTCVMAIQANLIFGSQGGRGGTT